LPIARTISAPAFPPPLRPSLGLLWQGISHPRWTAGTFLRTLAKHGIPHFENSYATREAPIVSSNVLRDFGRKDHLDWGHLNRIRDRWKGRLVVKGIMHPDDASMTGEMGVDGMIVSNHGGRQLDGTASPLQILPGIADRVGDKIPIMIDGGFRRGTYILKAPGRPVYLCRPALPICGRLGRAGGRNRCRPNSQDRTSSQHGSLRRDKDG